MQHLIDMDSKLYREGNKNHQKGLRPITKQSDVLHSKTGKYYCTKCVDNLQIKQKYKMDK